MSRRKQRVRKEVGHLFLQRAATAQQQISTDWTCAFCGEVYKEGSECSRDAEHWDEFTEAMSRPRHAHLQRGAA